MKYANGTRTDLRMLESLDILQPLMMVNFRNRQEGVLSAVSSGPMQLEKLSSTECEIDTLGGVLLGGGQFQVGFCFAQEGITWMFWGIFIPCGAS